MSHVSCSLSPVGGKVRLLVATVYWPFNSPGGNGVEHSHVTEIVLQSEADIIILRGGCLLVCLYTISHLAFTLMPVHD